MLVSIITAFVLLAEATIASTYGRVWELSWWEWHILLITAFGFVAYAAVVQWRREGSAAALFGAIGLRETLRDVQRSYAAALEAVVAAIEAGRPLTEEMAVLEDRFGLSERQIEVLVRAAEALAHERDMIRRQGAPVAVGQEASVIRTEEDLLDRVRAIAREAFAPDQVQVRLLHDGDDDPAQAAAPAGAGAGAGAGRSYALLVKGKDAGVVTVARPHGGIEARDEGLYASFASEVSIALENTRLYRQIDGLFRSYLSPDVVTSLLADPTQAELGGATQEVTILMADLRGFTPFAERSQPADVVAMLNVYFGCLVPIILDEGGTVVQFVGDALMAMFNAPVRQPDHPIRAARAALRGQAASGQAGAAHPDWPRFRMGIHTGFSLVGNIGNRDLRCFTAIGDTTNLAARLESVAPVGGVVISAATWERLGPGAQVEELGELTLKGKARPVAAYRLVALE
jgi:class 3 adenylate cyclase